MKWFLISMVGAVLLGPAGAASAPGTAGAARASAKAAPVPGVAAVPESGGGPDQVIRVTIFPSRNEVVPDGSYGVYAELENVSDRPVMLLEKETNLVVLPETSEPGACVDWERAIFPTQDRGKPGAGASNADAYLILQPRESYKVFWDFEEYQKGDKQEYNGRCRLPPDEIKNALGFVPGDYGFTVEGAAYVVPSSDMTVFAMLAASAAKGGASGPLAAAGGALSGAAAVNTAAAGLGTAPAAGAAAAGSFSPQDFMAKIKAGAVPAHYFSEVKTLHVGLSQLTTFYAAAFGAFLAYGLTALGEGQDWDGFVTVMTGEGTRARKVAATFALIRNAVAASLLGGVVTIVASRLSDTHFPVKVSVNDWWGALTIGFVAYFVGNKFVDGLATLGGAASKPSTLGQSPTPQGQGRAASAAKAEHAAEATKTGEGLPAARMTPVEEAQRDSEW
jgi:hypothetical protein